MQFGYHTYVLYIIISPRITKDDAEPQMYNLLITVYFIIRLLAVTAVILSDKHCSTLCLAKAYDQNVVALHAFESKCAQVHEMTCCNCVSKQSVIHSAKVFLCGTVI